MRILLVGSLVTGALGHKSRSHGIDEYSDYLATYYADQTRPVAACTCDDKHFIADRGTLGIRFATFELDTAQQCCMTCATNSRCTHFTYAPAVASQGVCNLNEGTMQLVNGSKYFGLISGEPPVAPPGPPPDPAVTLAPTPKWTGAKPHIVFFMADDVGHYNFGFNGNKEARTPRMDALVKEGVYLGRHYVYKYCSPTRTSFLSGRLPVHVSEKMSQLPDKHGIDVRMTTIAEKLTERGYATHQIGKYHAGSSFEGQLPHNKGFKTSFGYLSGMEDHYNNTVGYNNTFGGYVDLWDTDKPAYGRNGTQYNAFNFEQRALSIIGEHDPNIPLFLYLAWQNAHTPNQVPREFIDPTIDFELRRTFEGMVHCLDSGIGNVTDALKSKGMWDNTLVVFSSDNGGREDGDFGGNNYPLRGMKFTDFEGGIRAAAFVSGGLIPKGRRGATEKGLLHVADWFATFCNLAGCDPSDPRAGPDSFPDVDSVDQLWTLLQGGASPRQTVPLPISASALIVWPHKLVLGAQSRKGVWTGPQHPNSTKLVDKGVGCGVEGCLFNIEADPTEHNDLASSKPGLTSDMKNTLAHLQKGFYQFEANVHGGDDVYSHCVSQAEASRANKNFVAPVCTAAKGEITV